MMWKVAEPRHEADPILTRALDVLFILRARPRAETSVMTDTSGARSARTRTVQITN